MSWTAGSYLIYGVICDIDLISKRVRKSSCSHKYNSSSNFCPHCGTRVQWVREFSIESWGNFKVGEIGHCADYFDRDSGDQVLVGLCVQESFPNITKYKEVPSVTDAMIEKVQNFLKSIGYSGKEPRLYLTTYHHS